MFKTIGFLSREVGFLAKKWVLLMKKTNPYGKSIGKSPKTAKIGRKIAKSGWISTIFVENLTEHQARAYSGREALNRAHREAFRGKSQVGGNPENPGFYPALRVSESRTFVHYSPNDFFAKTPILARLGWLR